MKIEFESGANFITARHESGAVEIRCPFRLTDCGDAEPLDTFVYRHGGPEAAAEYLKERYRAADRT